jgi:hypothetical protein
MSAPESLRPSSRLTSPQRIMTHLRTSAWTLLVMLVLCAPPALGQTTPTAPDAQTRTALREKAFGLLESVASQLSTLQSPENRARLGSNIADLIWEHDEKRARAVLVSVEEDIKAGLQNTEEDEGLRVQTQIVFIHLRFNTVERIARHDPDLALSFLKATEVSSDSQLDNGPRWQERTLQLNLAKSIAAKNPEVALTLGRKILQRGPAHDLFPLLRQLNRKHRQQAQEFYVDIVRRLGEIDLADDPMAWYFAQALGRSFTPPAVDESAFRDLISVFNRSASAHGCTDKMADDDERSYFCSEVRALISQTQNVNSSPAARSTPSDAEGDSTWVPEAYEELNEIAETGTVEEILALATKYPQLEGDAQWRAFMKAQQAGDLDQARRIANDVRDPETKGRLLAQLERSETLRSMSSEKLWEEQQKFINSLPNLKDKAGMLTVLAGEVGTRDRKLALKLLAQAGAIADRMKPGKDQLQVQLVLAMVYCLEKSDRGFEIMEGMMPKLNEVIAATAKLDSYDNHSLRNGEWNMSNQGVAGELLTVMAQNAGYFAWSDLDRALGVAAQFERPEIRLMAQLKLAQGILAGPPRPLKFTPLVLR